MEIPADGLRINVGCGRRVFDGWVNCDAVANPEAPRPPEIICDFKSIPLPDRCARELMAIHVFEHAYRWETDALLDEWARLLRPGGRIILELPDLVKCCKNIIDDAMRGGKHKDQLGRWGLYGDPRTKDRFMCHPWGWTPAEVMDELRAHGFDRCRHLETMFHPAGRKHRDMRIEAIRV